MKTLGLLTIIILTLFSGACQKSEMSAVNTNSNAVNSTGNANQTTEQVSEPKGLKPSEPCGWFEASLKLTAKEYKESSFTPGLYSCVHVKPLDNLAAYSALEYHAIGDAQTIKEFFTYVRINKKNSAKQKENLREVLALVAMEIADKASGIKLSKEILTAILSEDTQEFTLDPGADSTKPQLKTVSVTTEPKPDDRGWYAIKVTLKF